MIYKNFILSDRLGKLTPNQTGLFTAGHVKHWLTVRIVNQQTGEIYTRRTTYQFNPSATKYRAGDGLLAVVADARCVADSPAFHDFCLEFGYSVDAPKARGAFKSCKASLQFFIDAGLTVEDLGNLQEELDA